MCFLYNIELILGGKKKKKKKQISVLKYLISSFSVAGII